jgi:hypothetical protein
MSMRPDTPAGRPDLSAGTDVLLEQALEAARAGPSQESDTPWAFIRELHRRGEAGIFEAAVRWCRAPEPLLREHPDVAAVRAAIEARGSK